MQRGDDAKLRRLEDEAERFSREIKQRESENEALKAQIAGLKSQIEEGQRKLAEIPDTADQKSTMKDIMALRKLSNKTEYREKEIARLRDELKKQRMKTFPSFPRPAAGSSK